MTTKIYLIMHLDTGMRYVGITDGELAKRWQQHYNDPKSAVYKALRTEGHRMTMELLEEVDNRGEALLKETAYIQQLQTAHPRGWNRTGKILPPIKWKKVFANPSTHIVGDYLTCPVCGCDFTNIQPPTYFEIGKSKGYQFLFCCEECHHPDIPERERPPYYELNVYSRTGHTKFGIGYHELDKS